MITTALTAILGLLAPASEPAQGAGSKLAIAIGKIESKAVGSNAYAPLTEGSSVAPNTWIQTNASSLASFAFSDGTTLRVSQNSEILIAGSRKITVRKGQIYVIAPAGNKTIFLIQVARTRFRSEGPEFAMGHDTAKRISTFFMIRGSSSVSTRRDSQLVTMGYWCQTKNGTLNTPDQAGDTVVVTAWSHPLLSRGGAKGAAELKTRLGKMLPWLGFLPGADDPYEEGFRNSGTACVPFLIGVLKVDPLSHDYKQRIAASHLVADMAVLKQAPELVGLLKDVEPDVRVNIARGLKRLAGDDLGHGDNYWKGDSRSAGEGKWAEWLKQNADKLR